MLRKSLLLLAAGVCSASALASAPTDWTVATGTSIQPVIDQAVDGDRIFVEPGTYPGAISFRGKAIEVIGINGSGATVLDGTGLTMPTVSFTSGESLDARLVGFQIRPSNSNNGAGVRMANSAGTLVDVRMDFVPNSGSYKGIYMVSSQLRYENGGCIGFENYSGGFIYVSGDDSAVEMVNSAFSYCYRILTQDGSWSGNQFSFENCVFGDELSDWTIFVSRADSIRLSDCTWSFGTGAVYYQDTDGAFECEGTTLANCSGTQFEMSPLATVTVTNSSFENITGQVFTVDSVDELSVDACSFLATGRAFSASSAGSVLLTASSFEECESGEGPALYVNSCNSVLVQDCTFRGNYASGRGGALKLQNVDGEGVTQVLNCAFTENASSDYGGAIDLRNQGLYRVENCLFLANETYRGGGALSSEESIALELRNCQFYENHNNYSYGNAACGGAVRFLGSSLSMEDCWFEGNFTQGSYGSDGGHGGAFFLYSGNAVLTRCAFFGNQSRGDGGAIMVDNNTSASLQVSDCRFEGNSALATVQVIHSRQACSVTNCMFVDNGRDLTTDWVIYFEPGSQPVQRSTFANNDGYVGRRAAFTDSIFWGHDGSPSECSFNYCCYEGGVAGAENIDDDPLFQDPDFGDFNTSPASPCRGAGSGGGDMGADLFLGIVDCNQNGVADASEMATGDCDGNGVLDDCELEGRDCNANGILDSCEIAAGTVLDCNGNGVPDSCDPDCNGNGIPDDCDIASGFSLDLDGNGVPDDCKPDCDLDGVPDYIEILYGTQLDCDLDGIPDSCAIASGAVVDCNGNGVPDTCDLAAGLETDCDGNGVPDSCDILTSDCNGNGIPDACDLASGSSLDLDQDGTPDECKPDCNANGLPDYLDIQFGSSIDCDGNGVPDECELDCNANGIADACDIASGFSADCNGNGLPDECEIVEGTETDCDLNGILDSCQIASGTASDCNGNGVLDACDILAGASLDCDLDGVPDECTLASGAGTDCNENGILDACDLAGGTSQDCNGNGIPDECEADCNGNGRDDACDIADGTSLDCNGNGVPDECEIAAGAESDCNGNGLPDSCELLSGGALDCNGNGVPDSCDLLAGTSLDCDGNGVPDECQEDCNGNGVADACDILGGLSLDCDGDGVPDECEIAQQPTLDLNGNGLLDSCECLVEPYCTTSPNTVGSGVTLFQAGTVSVSLNNLTLVATDGPPGQFVVFYYGSGQTVQPFGDGIKCVAGQLFRLPAVQFGPGGSASRSVDITAPPQLAGQIEAGSTWNFQAWYRDQGPGLAGYNFSDALAITFCP